LSWAQAVDDSAGPNVGSGSFEPKITKFNGYELQTYQLNGIIEGTHYPSVSIQYSTLKIIDPQKYNQALEFAHSQATEGTTQDSLDLTLIQNESEASASQFADDIKSFRKSWKNRLVTHVQNIPNELYSRVERGERSIYEKYKNGYSRSFGWIKFVTTGGSALIAFSLSNLPAESLTLFNRAAVFVFAGGLSMTLYYKNETLMRWINSKNKLIKNVELSGNKELIKKYVNFFTTVRYFWLEAGVLALNYAVRAAALDADPRSPLHVLLSIVLYSAIATQTEGTWAGAFERVYERSIKAGIDKDFALFHWRISMLLASTVSTGLVVVGATGLTTWPALLGLAYFGIKKSRNEINKAVLSESKDEGQQERHSYLESGLRCEGLFSTPAFAQ
jgi:hypothetical protein